VPVRFAAAVIVVRRIAAAAGAARAAAGYRRVTPVRRQLDGYVL